MTRWCVRPCEVGGRTGWMPILAVDAERQLVVGLPAGVVDFEVTF